MARAPLTPEEGPACPLSLTRRRWTGRRLVAPFAVQCRRRPRVCACRCAPRREKPRHSPTPRTHPTPTPPHPTELGVLPPVKDPGDTPPLSPSELEMTGQHATPRLPPPPPPPTPWAHPSSDRAPSASQSPARERPRRRGRRPAGRGSCAAGHGEGGLVQTSGAGSPPPPTGPSAHAAPYSAERSRVGHSPPRPRAPTHTAVR